MRIFRQVTIAFILASLGFMARAQAGISVSVILTEADTGAPVEFATVSLRERNSSKADRYTISDSKGQASFRQVGKGEWILMAELLGYAKDSVSFKVEGKDVNLGTLRLRQSSEAIDAASVEAVGNSIIVKKDTVEYNASAYLSTENDLLEDLLKKLPGVDVDDKGAVTVNGEKVTKITIDGKTFFLNDPKMATKNIPAKYIKKLKVIEKKSEQAEFTGIDDGERETVIDLSVDDRAMKGVFGNIMGGVGHDIPVGGKGLDDARYQFSAFGGRFTKKQRLNLVVNANNTNNRASTDLSGRSSQSEDGNGVTTNLMAGVNGAWTLFDNKMDLSSNYVFDHDRQVTKSVTDRTSYLNGSNLVNHNESNGVSADYGHRIGVRLDHKFSPNTSILFQPQVNFGHGTYSEASVFNTVRDRDGELIPTNEGDRQSAGKTERVNANGSLLFRQRIGIPGRTLTVRLGYSFNQNTNDGVNKSLNRTFTKTGAQKDSILDQVVNRDGHGASLSGRISYTEPLGAGFYVEGNYSLAWGRNTSSKDTYDAGGNYQVAYSNDIRNEYVNQKIGANLRYQKGKTKGQVGLSVNPTDTRNETMRKGIENEYENKVVNLAPQASFSCDLGDFSSLRFSYFGQTNQPSPSQLMPVPDVTNPLRISMGNPYLTPYYSNSMNAEFKRSDKKSYSFLTVRVRGNYVKDPIVNALCYSSDGVRYSFPVNGKGSLNGSMNVTFNSPIAKSNFSVYNYFSASYGSHVSYVSSEMDMSPYYDQGTGEFDFEKFNEDFKDIDSASEFTRNSTKTFGAQERLRLTYRVKNLEIQASGHTRVNKSWYTITTEKDATWNNGVSGSVTYNWNALGLSFDTQCHYKWYDGYASPREDELIWNARVSKLLFKKKVTASVRAFDIFGQERALSVSDSANQHRETLDFTLGRYVIASLTYRFGGRSRPAARR